MGSSDDGFAFSNTRTDADFEKIWHEAKSRWLRPIEVFDILHNHIKFPICSEPPNLPPSGTLILFNRKMLRNFRRDGHPWKKKKDNKTVKEAHEHLKVGSEEKIHVYYAHGEGGSNLQRRVYWLLDKSLEHIVLVHYLEVKEGSRATIIQQPWTSMQSGQPAGMYMSPLSPLFSAAGSGLSSESSPEFTLTQQMDYSEFDSNDDFDKFSLEDLRSTGEMGMIGPLGNEPWLLPPEKSSVNHGNVESLNQTVPKEGISNSGYDGLGLAQNQASGALSQTGPMCLNMVKDVFSLPGHEIAQRSTINSTEWEQMPTGPARPVIHEMTLMNADHLFASTGASSDSQVVYKSQMNIENRENNVQWPLPIDSTMPFEVTEGGDSMEATVFYSQIDNGDVFKKLDSLDRWMKRELPDHENSPLATSVNSSSYNDTLVNEQIQSIEEASCPAWQTQETEDTTPSFGRPFLFQITDYSPTWSFLQEETKVIVTGQYMGDPNDFFKITWCCMFGDIMVPAEIVQPGVLRCRSPKVGPRQVTFCVTDGTQQPCSELREFEFRNNSIRQKDTSTPKGARFSEDFILQVRFAQLLLGNGDQLVHKLLGSTAHVLPKVGHLSGTIEDEWAVEALYAANSVDLLEAKDQLIQMFLQKSLAHVVASKEKKQLQSFDKLGQGILHLASALGYEWVVAFLMSSGTSINFRDKKGWTALHWAAYYGREKMVAALLAAGAKPGMVSDPTPENPAGCTPADVAAEAGYDGIAGYLSEHNLIDHLESLTLGENEHDKQLATDQGHRVVEYLRRSVSLRKSVKNLEDEVSLEDSLSAMGKATMAAARIHAAFREYTFRAQLHAIEEVDEYGLLPEEMKALIAAEKIQRAYRSHRDRKIKESAALQIQNRYRVWKSRRDFVNRRQKAIKIQAYFRMHRARKQFSKILWSVGILEKALLRWRQRRKGLRGFQAEVIVSVQGVDKDDFLAAGRKQAEDALDRSIILVQSMVRSRLARQQYKRMLENFKQAKIVEMEALNYGAMSS